MMTCKKCSKKSARLIDCGTVEFCEDCGHKVSRMTKSNSTKQKHIPINFAEELDEQILQEQKQKHTPTPLHLPIHLGSGSSMHSAPQKWYSISDDKGNTIAEVVNYDDEKLTKRTWEHIVRACNSHEALVSALNDMTLKWHNRCDHKGYLHNCADPLCVDNFKALNQAKKGA